MLGNAGGGLQHSKSSNNIHSQNGSLIVNKLPFQSSDNQVTSHTGSGGGSQLPSVYPIHYIGSTGNLDQQSGHVYQSSTSNGQGMSYQDYGNTVYSLGGGQYYHSGNASHHSSGLGGGSSVLHSSGLPSGTHLITHQGNAIILQGGNMGGGIMQDLSDNLSLPHHTRASPVTVQWLTENYENADGVSLPRSTLYCHYVRHCQEQKLDPMNPASFGKLIRSVFMGLRTRRLGTRGNSKYHYYGIRIKPTSALNQFVEDKALYATRNYPNFHKPGFKSGLSGSSLLTGSGNHMRPSLNNAGSMQHMSGGGGGHAQSAFGNVAPRSVSNHVSMTNNMHTMSARGHDNAPSSRGSTFHSAQNSSVSALPDLREVCDRAQLPSRLVNRIMGSEDKCRRLRKEGNGADASQDEGDAVVEMEDMEEDELDEYEEDEEDEDETPVMPLPSGCSDNHVIQFVHMYAKHCDRILQSVVNLNFDELETIWRHFWRTGDEDNYMDGVITEEPEEDPASVMSRKVFFSLVEWPTLQKFITEADHSFYQSLVEVLIPDVFKPHPQTLTQAIRNFAKCLESWMRGALQPMLSYQDEMDNHVESHSRLPMTVVQQKLASVSALAHVLRRYTSLNHLAQAARAVLVNSQQISQMLTDLNRIDFSNIQEQASWIFRCRKIDLMTDLEGEFKRILQQQSSLEEWGRWLDQVVSRILAEEEEHSKERFIERAQQFILKWSYYSSLVIRDLTLRSASSFGSFHLIRLLYDEYVYYLVEHKVASYEHVTPIASISKMNLEKMRSEESKKAKGKEEDTNSSNVRQNDMSGDALQSMDSDAYHAAAGADSDKQVVHLSSNAPSHPRPTVKIVRNVVPGVPILTQKSHTITHSGGESTGVARIISHTPRKSVVVTSVFDADLETTNGGKQVFVSRGEVTSNSAPFLAQPSPEKRVKMA